jgi:hypothetical protein
MTTNTLAILSVIVLIGLYVAAFLRREGQRERWDAERRWNDHVNQAMTLLDWDCPRCHRHHAGAEDCRQWNDDSGSRGRHPSA